MEELDTTPTVTTSQMLLTPEGYTRLHAELENLTVNKRAEIAERLRDSKQHGEFSEDNSELDEVKFEQAMVENRINELKAIFAGAQQLELDMIPTDFVGVGSYVTVKDVDRGASFEIRMVASIEADPDNDLISNEAPMGVALMGRKLGETIEFDAPAGRLRYKIEQIRR
ncbi:MAG: transcription elongation factor GreA [Fimbriimonadaceae bacterium]|nr:transcription elongation factor GreA [Fimbriimonadaceae bacterium]